MVREKLLDIGEDKLVEKVSKKFYGMDFYVRVIYRALISNKNIILWGRGGFGKTSILKEIARVVGLPLSVVVGYEDMDVESLIGIPNMDKLLKDSEYVTAFDKTKFSNPGIMVLEEFLDVNSKTAIALKDIITEGGLRQGDSFIPSKVENFIICSNKNPDEVSIDNSTSAFYKERFPVRIEVKLPDTTYQTYLRLIKTKIGEEEYSKHRQEYEALAELCNVTSADYDIVSPRLVCDAIDVLQNTGYDIYSLSILEGLDTSNISAVLAHCDIRNETNYVYYLKSQLNKVIGDLLKSTANVAQSISVINYIKERLTNIEITHEDNVAIIKDLLSTCDRSLSVLWAHFESISDTDKQIIDKIFDNDEYV